MIWPWCFNPCFDGSVERGVPSCVKIHSIVFVSILVLMEVLREENLGGLGRRW